MEGERGRKREIKGGRGRRGERGRQRGVEGDRGRKREIQGEHQPGRERRRAQRRMRAHELLHEGPRPVQHEPLPRRPAAAAATPRPGRCLAPLAPLASLAPLAPLVLALHTLLALRAARGRCALPLEQPPHRLAVHRQAGAAQQRRQQERVARCEGGEQRGLREAPREGQG